MVGGRRGNVASPLTARPAGEERSHPHRPSCGGGQALRRGRVLVSGRGGAGRWGMPPGHHGAVPSCHATSARQVFTASSHPHPLPPPFPSPPRTPFAAGPAEVWHSPPPPAKPLVSPSPLSTDPRGGARPRELCMGMCRSQNLRCWMLVGPLTNADTARKASSTRWVVEQVDESGAESVTGGRRPSPHGWRLRGGTGPRRGGPTRETACDRSSSSQLTRAARLLTCWANLRQDSRLVGRHPKVDAAVDIRSFCSPRDFFVLRAENSLIFLAAPCLTGGVHTYKGARHQKLRRELVSSVVLVV